MKTNAKKTTVILLSLVLSVFCLASCNDNTSGGGTVTPDPNADYTESNILVAYFSLAGDQYSVGVIEKGNTQIVAEMIAQETGADEFQIDPVVEYPTDSYSALLDFVRNEPDRPAIENSVENFAEYDVIFIGYPIWWSDMPNIVYHFLESYDFSGKTVLPFCTHGGSGLAGTDGTIGNLLTGATVYRGLAISGTTAQNNRPSALSSVRNWLNESGLAK